MADEISYTMTLDAIDWEAMKATLAADDFDNGRSPAQLRSSFEHSYASAIAYAAGQIIGTARVLSDGVCNAYIVDVWTLTPYRRRGVARTMISMLEDRLAGQHIYLFTDDAMAFYQKLGFREQPTGMSKVVGQWLQPNRDGSQ